MSFDPNQNAPVGHAAPKKSGALKWIIGGLGCFGLLTLLCVGGVVGLGFWGMGMIKNEAYEEARTAISNSAEVSAAVGDPVNVGDFEGFQQATSGEQVTYTYQIPVNGSNKSGTAEVIVSGNPINGGWKIDSMEVEVDGEKIPVGELDLEVDIEE